MHDLTILTMLQSYERMTTEENYITRLGNNCHFNKVIKRGILCTEWRNAEMDGEEEKCKRKLHTQKTGETTTTSYFLSSAEERQIEATKSREEIKCKLTDES